MKIPIGVLISIGIAANWISAKIFPSSSRLISLSRPFRSKSSKHPQPSARSKKPPESKKRHQAIRMGSAEEMAKQFESGIVDQPEGVHHGGKRTKAEHTEHKHAHPEGDTRRIGESNSRYA